jgi:hypothetical protein
MQTRALVDFREPSLNRAMQVYGRVGDLSFFDGMYYPSKAPFLSFAAVPIYAGLRVLSGGPIGSVPELPLVFAARLFLTVIPTLLSLILVRRFLATYLSEPISDSLTLFYALGTLAFSYSLLFMSHQTTATLLFAAFFLIWRFSRGERPQGALLAAGALGGLAVAAEYTSAMPAGLLALYVFLVARELKHPWSKPIALLATGATPVIGLLIVYHWKCFGGPLETGYRHLADVAYQPWHTGGFLGIRTPDPRALLLSFFSPLRGLFPLAPALILGFLGIPRFLKHGGHQSELRPVAIFTLVLVAAYVYFTASFSYDSWGWTTGPRHLTGLVPFLLLPAGLLMSAFTSPLARGVCVGLLLASVFITAALSFVNYVPDDMSDALLGLALPLARSGYFVPTIFNFWGWANPLSGAMLETIPILVGLVVAWSLVPSRQLGVYSTGVALTLAVMVAAHSWAFQDTPQDRGALGLLKTVWLAPPGHAVQFWSNFGR